MNKVKLREICHSRAGDKGDTANVSLIAYDKEDYDWIRRRVTAERVKEFFKGIVQGKVERFELPKLGALNFVLHKALDGGATRSLWIDAYGKSFSSLLLGLEIEKDSKPE
jgi:hypothetical protein